MAKSNKDVKITIKVSGEGDFTYDPSVKRIKAGESITWVSSQGPFSISFKDGTPFEQLDFHSELAGKEWRISSGKLGALPGPGHFHYAVAVFSVKDETVYLDAACPEVIVTN